jgi:hypothetical protein
VSASRPGARRHDHEEERQRHRPPHHAESLPADPRR